MERHGFIHTMQDVKVLILFMMNHVEYPVTEVEMYDLCFWDESLSYFDFKIAIPEMVTSGHLSQENGRYTITSMGKEACPLVQSSLAYPVGKRVLKAVSTFNEDMHRREILKTNMELGEDHTFHVSMELKGDLGKIFTMSFLVDSEEEAEGLETAMASHGEEIYETIKSLLLEEI